MEKNVAGEKSILGKNIFLRRTGAFPSIEKSTSKINVAFMFERTRHSSSQVKRKLSCLRLSSVVHILHGREFGKGKDYKRENLCVEHPLFFWRARRWMGDCQRRRQRMGARVQRDNLNLPLFCKVRPICDDFVVL